MNNILKPDSPVMELLRTIADVIILNLLFVICSIPIVTFGASYSAKYYVAMKIVKGEESGVVKPFFKAFKQNFKQSTIVWLIMMLVIAVLAFDWSWVQQKGWAEVPFAYKFGIIVFTVLICLINMALFPTIARYKMKTTEVFKASLIFVIIRIFPLIGIALLIFGSVFASIWYAQWFPLIYAISSTAITYFLALVCVKQFDKLEKAQADKIAALKAAEAETDNVYDQDAVGNMSLASAKKDLKELEKDIDKPAEAEEEVTGNRITKFIKKEKKKLSKLTGKQKATYLAQYYLPAVIVIILVIGGFTWYGIDVYNDSRIVFKVGLFDCEISESGEEYLTSGYLAWGEYKKSRKVKIIDSEHLVTHTNSDYENVYLDMSLKAQIMTGGLDYLIIPSEQMDVFGTDSYFQDVSKFVDLQNFSENQIYYYQPEEGTSDMGSGKSLYELFGNKQIPDGPVPIAFELTDEIEERLGLDQSKVYYLAFAIQPLKDKSEEYAKVVDYLYGEN